MTTRSNASQPAWRGGIVVAVLLICAASSFAPLAGQIADPFGGGTNPDPFGAGPAADPFAAGDNAKSPAADEQKISATLLQVKADWSEVEDAETVRGELETLLEGTELPEAYRKDLLRYAPRILFSYEFVSLYERDEFAGLLKWLMEHKLVQAGGRATPVPPPGDDPLAAGVSQPPGRLISSVIGEDILPIPNTKFRGAAPPFAKRTFETEWQFTAVKSGNDPFAGPVPLPIATNAVTVEISSTAQMRQHWQTDDQPVDVQSLHHSRNYHFDLPLDKVAVWNMLHGQPRDTLDRVQRLGWEPLWMILPDTGPLAVSAQSAALAKPAGLVEPTSPVRRRPRPANPPQPSNPQQPEPDEAQQQQQINVFYLQFVQAKTAGDVVKQLVSDANFSVAVDERLNAIIASGTAETLGTVEALLLKLDEGPKADAARANPADNQPGASANRAVFERLAKDLRERYSASEAQAKQLAGALGEDLDRDADTELRQRLTKLVGEAFSLRQQLQEMEVKLLQERIRAIEAQLRRRAHLQDAVIKRRVDQLLAGPAVPDEPGGVGAAKTATDERVTLRFNEAPWTEVLRQVAESTKTGVNVFGTPPGTLTYETPQPLDPQNAWEAVAALLPEGWILREDRGIRTVQRETLAKPIDPASASAATKLRSPEELGRAAAEVKKAIATAGDYRDGETRLQEAKSRLELLRAEYATQLQILEVVTKRDQKLLELADRQLVRIVRLKDERVATDSQVDAARLEREKASAAHLQSELLLDLYKKVAETTRLLEDDDPASPDRADAVANPGSGVVWIEAIVPGAGGDEDEPQRVASYRNGAVVSEDGLIAVAFDKPTSDALANAGENNPRDNVAVSVFFENDARFAAKVVAFHPSSGLALLQIEASGLSSFDCGPAVGMNQRVRYYSTSGLDGQTSAIGPPHQTQVYETQVSGIPGFPIEVSPGTFQINGGQVAGRSGLVVANGGKLVGLATRVDHNRVDPAVANDTIRVVCLDAGLVKELLDQIAAPPSPEPSGQDPP